MKIATACLLPTRLVILNNMLVGSQVEKRLGLRDQPIPHPKDPDELVAVLRTRRGHRRAIETDDDPVPD